MSVLTRHHRWNVLGLLMLAQGLAIGIHTYCFAFWVLPWLDEFGAPRSELMLIISASAIVVGVVSPFAGRAFDRLPARTLFCTGTLVYAGCLFLISLAESHRAVLLLYALLLPVGVVLNGNLAGQVLITRWFSANRGFAIGLGAMGISVGAFILPPLVTALLDSHGWRITFQWLGVAMLLLVLPAAWVILRQEPESQSVPNNGGGQAASGWTTLALLRNRNFWIISGGFFAFLGAILPVQFSLGTYANELGISQRQAALIASMTAVANAVGKVAYGRLVDTLAPRHTYWIAAAGVALAVSIVSGADGFALLAAGMMLIGFSLGCILPVLSGLVVAYFGTRAFGQVVGLAWTVITFSAVTPYLSGLILDAGNAYPPAFLALLLPLLPAGLAMRMLPERPCELTLPNGETP